MHGHRLHRDRDLYECPDGNEGGKQAALGQITDSKSFFSHPFLALVCLAPVNHFLRRLAADDAGVGKLFLLKRHTAGGDADGLL